MTHTIPRRGLAGLAAIMLAAAACNSGTATNPPSQAAQGSTPPASAGASASATGPFSIGYSNGGGVG
ncbi:MAG TPA: hypothetical protein VET90_10000, partial [Candidatus Binatus sp.]|nr:hypothetical protein [Candidatus Binatus sp.]